MIRWLGAKDLVEWRDIRAEGLRLNPTAFLTTLDEFLAESDASVAAKLSKGKVLGAFVDGALQAVAAVNQMSGKAQTKHRAEISAVYARPATRGTGLAMRLMEHAAKEACAQGVTQLELFVETQNVAALKFYEKLGFKRCGTVPNASVTDRLAHDDYFMVRLLDR